MDQQATTLGALNLSCLAARSLAGEVRRRIELRLIAWGLGGLAPDVRLVAAELVANACAVTPEGRIKVRFTREPGSVLLAVWDASDLMPRIRVTRELELADLDLTPEHFDDNGGWGLHLVRALSAECGVSRTEPDGKWLWSRFAAPEG